MRRETARCLAALREGGGEVPVYPGIDIDIPTGEGQRKTQPDEVRAGIRGAFAGGAHGVILSRETPSCPSRVRTRGRKRGN